MSLKVIGAGLGRTGTMSLKLALEKLLGGPCYHMTELFEHLDEHLPHWQRAADGEPVNWNALFKGYVAAVDEPVSLVWRQLMDYYPKSLVVLSERDAESWWHSANETILRVKREEPEPGREAWHRMIEALYAKQYPAGFDEPAETQQRFLSHNEAVRNSAPRDRLVIWRVEDGWEPLCKALELPVPDEPFPQTNTLEEFKSRRNWD